MARIDRVKIFVFIFLSLATAARKDAGGADCFGYVGELPVNFLLIRHNLCLLVLHFLDELEQLIGFGGGGRSLCPNCENGERGQACDKTKRFHCDWIF